MSYVWSKGPGGWRVTALWGNSPHNAQATLDSMIFGPTPAAASGVHATGASAQALQTATGSASVEFNATGASVQRVQASTGAGSVEFNATGASVQHVQSSSGSGHTVSSGVHATGASVQRVQSSNGAASVEFNATGASVQRTQTSQGASSVEFNATGASAQALQVSTGSASVEFNATGSGSQALQASSGAGHSGGGAAGVHATGTSAQVPQVSYGQASSHAYASAPMVLGRRGWVEPEKPKTVVKAWGYSFQARQKSEGYGHASEIPAAPAPVVELPEEEPIVEITGVELETVQKQAEKLLYARIQAPSEPSNIVSATFGASGASSQSVAIAAGQAGAIFEAVGTTESRPNVSEGSGGSVFGAFGSSVQPLHTSYGEGWWEDEEELMSMIQLYLEEIA